MRALETAFETPAKAKETEKEKEKAKEDKKTDKEMSGYTAEAAAEVLRAIGPLEADDDWPSVEDDHEAWAASVASACMAKAVDEALKANSLPAGAAQSKVVKIKTLLDFVAGR